MGKTKTKRKRRRRRNPKVMQVGRGQNNLNVNISLNNKVITSRRRQNLREVRRALPSSKALQGYKQFNVPDLHSQSAVLTNNMMSQFNNVLETSLKIISVPWWHSTRRFKTKSNI